MTDTKNCIENLPTMQTSLKGRLFLCTKFRSRHHHQSNIWNKQTTMNKLSVYEMVKQTHELQRAPTKVVLGCVSADSCVVIVSHLMLAVIFSITPILSILVEEMEFFSLFLLLGEIRRVLSGKMAINQLKISQKIDLDNFQGIDWHREVKKVTVLSQFHRKPPP